MCAENTTNLSAKLMGFDLQIMQAYPAKEDPAGVVAHTSQHSYHCLDVATVVHGLGEINVSEIPRALLLICTICRAAGPALHGAHARVRCTTQFGQAPLICIGCFDLGHRILALCRATHETLMKGLCILKAHDKSVRRSVEVSGLHSEGHGASHNRSDRSRQMLFSK